MTVTELAARSWTGRSSARRTPARARSCGGYVSDLLSDVMAHAQDGDVWITMQRHVNTSPSRS